MKWLETNGTKAAIPGINRQNIEELEFPDPEQESVQDFCKRIQPYFTAIFRNCLENKQLQSLRDTLLPRLMSGEIDVSKVDLTQLTNNHLSGCGSFCSVCCPSGLASEFHEWFREHFFFGYGHLCKADLG